MRLIDADALLENYNLKNATKYGNKDAEQQEHSYSTLMLYEVADMIEDAPTIDAVLVVHGRNMMEDAPSLFGCSVCGWECHDTLPGDTEKMKLLCIDTQGRGGTWQDRE